MLQFLKKIFGSNKESVKKALENGAIILDVRTASEYKQGHIKGSKNIPLQEVKLKSEMIRKWNKPIVTVCRSGSRSSMAKGILSSAGIETYNGGSWSSINNLIR
jgi:phage shock protein E